MILRRLRLFFFPFSFTLVANGTIVSFRILPKIRSFQGLWFWRAYEATKVPFRIDAVRQRSIAWGITRGSRGHASARAHLAILEWMDRQ